MALAGMGPDLGRIYYLLMHPIYCRHPGPAPPDAPAELVEAWNKPQSNDRGSS